MPYRIRKSVRKAQQKNPSFTTPEPHGKAKEAILAHVYGPAKRVSKPLSALRLVENGYNVGSARVSFTTFDAHGLSRMWVTKVRLAGTLALHISKAR